MFHIRLDDGLELSFTDKRRFAKVRLLKNPASAPPISELGPDALLEPMTEDELFKALSKKKISIKALLLDQSFISGVGNWIADEVLYQMDSIGENTVATYEKQSNFVPVLRFGDWSDIGNKPYMEDAHICIPNLAEKFGDQVPGKEIVSLYGGKRLVFVTNNSTKSRKQYGKKFETLGLSVNEEEIFASSFAAAAYLQSIDFPKDKKIYVIGEEGILIELELAGFSYLGGPEDGGKKIELKPGFYMEHDENVGAVVVGFDRYFNYYKVQYGTLCIRENPGCLFLATNRDAVTHLTDAQEWAGGGSMVGALVGSTQREPLTVGKPSTFMMDYLANKFGITKSQICMVGDILDTDILFGQNGGCKTLLVLSGVTSLSMLQNPNNSIQPDFYTNKISDFLSLKAATV